VATLATVVIVLLGSAILVGIGRSMAGKRFERQLRRAWVDGDEPELGVQPIEHRTSDVSGRVTVEQRDTLDARGVRGAIVEA